MMRYAQTSRCIEQSAFPAEANCKLQIGLSESQFKALQPSMVSSIAASVSGKARETIRYVWEDPRVPRRNDSKGR